MENFQSDWDMKNLVKELTEGREIAKQLQTDLNNVQSSSSHVTRDFLLQKIINSYDQSLAMIKHGRPGGGASGGEAPPPPPVAVAALDSPRSLIGSPQTDDSDQDLRKAVTKWTKKVKVCTETGIEGQLDDGFSWRKYGQKDIIGAIYPRGYYRCTHRHNQGCLATKQVQRSNDDPTIYEVTYRRKHTCSPRANPSNNNNNDPPTPMPDPRIEDPNPLPETLQNQPNIQTGLTVIAQDLGPKENPPFDPFNFPSSSTINHENNNIFLGNYSPKFMFPLASGSDYFSVSPRFMNNNYDGIVLSNLNISESEFTPIVAAITSTTNSPTLEFGSSEFGSNFGFGDPGYYP